MRRTALTVAEIAGLAAFVYGAGLLAAWAGWMLGGLLTVVVAVALDDGGRSDK